MRNHNRALADRNPLRRSLPGGEGLRKPLWRRIVNYLSVVQLGPLPFRRIAFWPPGELSAAMMSILAELLPVEASPSSAPPGVATAACCS